MAGLNVTTKLAATLQTIDTPNITSASPDSVSQSFSAQNRIEKQVYTIPALGTATIALASEGFTACNLLKVECLTPGKPFNLKFNGDAVGVTMVAPSGSDKAVFIANADFTSMVITNPDSAVPVSVCVSMFEKAP